LGGYAHIRDRVQAQGLDIFGGFLAAPDDLAPEGTGTLLLLGPHEPGFWPMFTETPEFRDHQPDAMDRWSARVISALAADLGAAALFPFGGPPHQPFIRWAMRSGRAWQSPAGMLVHDRAGLMVSFRGALALPECLDLPPVRPSPCESCTTLACMSSCPVSALSAATGYDVGACHGDLTLQGSGGGCMSRGCAARRACPVSQSYGRVEAQSAYHMSYFH
jgi:hypothetical protein